MHARRDQDAPQPRANERKAGYEGQDDALVHACALSIVHAQYRRALGLAESTVDVRSRARAFREARRLVGVAVALAARARAVQGAEAEIGRRPRREATEVRQRNADSGTVSSARPDGTAAGRFLVAPTPRPRTPQPKPGSARKPLAPFLSGTSHDRRASSYWHVSI
jgi:hypothetical protein